MKWLLVDVSRIISKRISLDYLLGIQAKFFLRRALRSYRALFAIVLILSWFSLAPLTVSPTTSRKKPTETKPLTYLALGDSTGLGVGAQNGRGYVEQLLSRIQKDHPGSRVVKLCRLGETATSLRQRITDRISVKPTFVTLSIGINDVLQGTTEKEFTESYEEIVKSLKRLAVPIVVTNLPYISSAPSLPNSLRQSANVKILLFNKRIGDLAERYDLLLVNLYEVSHKLIIKDTRFFSSDGFHPSDAGYRLWTQIMWPTVKLAISRVSKPSYRSIRSSWRGSSGDARLDIAVEGSSKAPFPCRYA